MVSVNTVLRNLLGKFITLDGAMSVDETNNNILAKEHILFKNNKGIKGTFTDNTTDWVVNINQNNNTVLGYGSYNSQKGSTNIYGNDAINLVTNGNFRINNHVIGEAIKSGTGSASVKSGSYTTLASITLSAGLYIILGYVDWEVSSNSTYNILIQTTDNSLSGCVRTSMSSGGGDNIVRFWELTETKTIQVKTYQGSGSTYTGRGFVEAIRIM